MKSVSKKDPFVAWMLLGIPILFIIASPLHFLFEWSGKSVVAALFTPVNESPWEHLKLTFWPILIWWTIGYLLFGKQKKWSFSSFAVSCAVAEVICTLFIISFFYTYTGAFGVESLIIDIISLFLGLFFGISLATHVYKHTKPVGIATFLAVLILIIMAAAFIYFTFAPPHIPLFKDPPTGSYGL